MAVPKRKKSRSRTRTRRAQWKADTPPLIPVTVAAERVLIPRRLARAAQKGMIDVS